MGLYPRSTQLIAVALGLLLSAAGTGQERSKDPSSSWARTGGPPGGAILTIRVHPKEPRILYAGGAGGVFRSLDRGVRWERLGPRSGETRVASSIRIHPSRPDVLYVLLQETPGLFRSEDGGKRWMRLDDGFEEGECPRNLAIAPDDPKILYLATNRGRVLKSADGGDRWGDPARSGFRAVRRLRNVAVQAPSAEEVWFAFASEAGASGLLHSVDGGRNWKEVSVPRPKHAVVSNLFVDRDVIYAGLHDPRNMGRQGGELLLRSADRGRTWERPGLKDAGCSGVLVFGKSPSGTMFVAAGPIHKSADEGRTWTALEKTRPLGPLDPTEMAFDPADPRTLYVAYGSAGIGRSTDEGRTWTLIHTGLVNSTVSLLAADPRDPRTLYATSATGEGIFRTADAGRTWRRLDVGEIGHPWGDEIAVRPTDSRGVWFVTDTGRLFTSADAGRRWICRNPEDTGFSASSVYALAIDPKHPERIYACKNGFGLYRSENGGREWRFLRTSVDYTYAIAIDPDETAVVYTGHNKKPFESGARVARSADRGETWETVLERKGADAFTSVMVDRKTPRRVLAGSAGPEGLGGAVYLSSDRGRAWAMPNPHLTFTSVHALAADGNIAYAGVWDGGIYKTADGGIRWRRLERSPLSVRKILLDPRDRKIVYAADRLNPYVFISRDGGENWKVWFDVGRDHSAVSTMGFDAAGRLYVSALKRGGMEGTLYRVREGASENVTNGLPRAVSSIAVGRGLCVALHGGGIYFSRDGGGTWSAAKEFSDVRVCDLAADPGRSSTIYAAIVGRGGVYRSTDGGATWRYLGSGKFQDVRTKAVLADGERIFAATEEGVFHSGDSGRTWEDWGESLGFKDVGVLAKAGGLLYAGSRGGGVFVTPAARKAAWRTGGPVARVVNVRVRFDPVDSRLFYASSYPGGFFLSRDGGRSWHERNVVSTSFTDLVGRAPNEPQGLNPVISAEDPDIQRSYPFDVCPSNPAFLCLATYEGGLFVSVDGAETWAPVTSLGSDLRVTAVRFDERNPRAIYVTTQNGFHVSDDCGVSWIEREWGLSCKDLYSMAVDPRGRIYAGSRGYGVYRFDPARKKWRATAGLGQWGVIWPAWGRPLYQYTSVLFHPTDPNVVYVGTFPAGIFKSIDGGKTWREKNIGWTNDGVFCLVFHPENPQVIYAGTYNGINISTDGAEHWKTWDRGWPPEQWVFSIAFDPKNPRVMYAASKNGENKGEGRRGFHGTVMKSVDGGATWFEITRGLDKENEFYAILVDPRDSRRLYLATQHEGIFRSRNAGESWEPWNEGLTNRRAGTNGNNVTRTLVLSADGRTLYFGTAGSGVFRRELR